MAAFYASSPPPEKPPPIAPNKNSELNSPSQESASEKKSSFIKRALKELTGGWGHSQKVKGLRPVVRPYGRGGVGGMSSAKTLSSSSSPQSTLSESSVTDSSLAQQQQQRHLQVPHPQGLPPSRDDTPFQSQYGYSDYDDTQSLASSIPAPRRTQRWIQQQAPLNSAPMSPTSSNDPYGAQSYVYGQHPSRLHDVEEDDDPATHMDDQFGRLSVANSSVIRDHQSVPGRSDPRSRLVLHPSSSVSVGSRPPVTAAREIAASYYGASSSTSASRPPVDPFAANSYNSFLPPHHHLPPSQPQSVVDHYSAAHAQNQAVHARSHLISAQTQELQAQIENLRESERRARERLKALRRDDNLPLRKNTSSEDESPLDGRPPPPRSATSPIPPSRREGNISKPGMDGSEILEGPSSSMTPARPLVPPKALGYGPMSREERAREEKERLRQRDREREEANAAYHQQHDPYATPANLYAQQYQRGAPSYHPPPASTFSQSAYPSHMQSHIPHNPPPSMASTSAPVQHFHHQQQQHPPQPQPQPQPQQPQAFANSAQQQLILQLGALLIQQQQQLAALNASRPEGSSGASPPASGLPLPSPGGGALDLSALLTLAAAAANLDPAAAAAALAAVQNANGPAQTQALSTGLSSSPTTRINQISPPQIPVPPIPITSTTFSDPKSQGGRLTPSSQSTQPAMSGLSRLKQDFAGIISTTDTCHRFRILIMGKANSGKTTILQKFMGTIDTLTVNDKDGKMLDASMIEDPILMGGVHNIEFEITSQSNPYFVFHDSRGLEAGSSQEMEEIRKFIDRRAQERELKDRLHLIWYCIPMDQHRVLSAAELAFFEQGTGDVPVIAVFTKWDGQILKSLAEILKDGKTRMTLRDARQEAHHHAKEVFEKHYLPMILNMANPPATYVLLGNMHKPDTICNELSERTTELMADFMLRNSLLKAQSTKR
ncbi:hypothetical protein FRC03_012243 [Tulasnella sp. 419]|nr:hypothetical protein FRC03_012243 [Tulasnella sp. 419]